MNETDVKVLCRICLNSSTICSNIYVGQSSDRNPIYEVINYVYDLEISVDDGLPEHVCQECLGIIKEFEIYKRNAHRAKKELILLKQKKNTIFRPEDICYSNKSFDESSSIENASENQMYIKQEEDEDYLEGSGPEVTSDGHIHEPQIEIHVSANYENPTLLSQEDELLPRKGDGFSLRDSQAGIPVRLGERPRRGRNIRGRRGRRPGAVGRPRSAPRNDERIYKCEDCGKSFADEDRLSTHVLVHSGEKPFECVECGRRFNRKNYLNEHLMIHSGHKPFQCMECDKKFIRKYDLNIHQMMHRGEKPFECGECGKGFLRNNELTKHLKIHSGLKPWECPDCGKGFIRKCDLKRHQTIHNR